MEKFVKTEDALRTAAKINEIFERQNIWKWQFNYDENYKQLTFVKTTLSNYEIKEIEKLNLRYLISNHTEGNRYQIEITFFLDSLPY